jgi:hypothetical protein
VQWILLCRHGKAPMVIHVNFYTAKVDNIYFPQVDSIVCTFLPVCIYSMQAARTSTIEYVN